MKHHACIDHSWSPFIQPDVACSFYTLKELFCGSHFHYCATRPGKCILPCAPARPLTRGTRPAVCVKVLTCREKDEALQISNTDEQMCQRIFSMHTFFYAHVFGTLSVATVQYQWSGEYTGQKITPQRRWKKLPLLWQQELL